MSQLEKSFVNSRWHSHQVARQAAARLEGLPIRPGQRFLDIGCGNGAAAIYVARKFGLDVSAVDVDPDQVREATAAAAGLERVAFARGDGTRLPFPDGSFDVVAANKVMHHIANWTAALGEMTRVVRPDGFIIFSDLALPRWLAAPLKPMVAGRAGVFTAEDLDRWFRQARLRPVRRRSGWFGYTAVFVRMR